MSKLRFRSALLALGFALALGFGLPAAAAAQVVSQSDLTLDDNDPSFRLTLEHLSQELRWLGVSPRQITWSPDGQWVYFRWREDPEADQHRDTDPWYATDRDGKKVRRVSPEEVATIPSRNIVWSGDRRVAAWSTGGTLYIWTRGAGTRPVYAAANNLGHVSIAWDGSKVLFATQGFGRFAEESGDLWAYDLEDGAARQVAAVRTKPEEPENEGAKWLEEQQLELIEVVRIRERDREVADSVRRVRAPERPQSIPVDKKTRAYNIQLSPDGRFLTFMWQKGGLRENRTSYMEFINKDGQATEKKARPKVGEPLPTYRMGIVRIDPLVDPDSVEVLWVDDGTDNEIVIHGPFWDPTGRHAVVQILSMDHKDRWISLLDLESGETAVLDHQHADDWIGGPLVVGRWSPGFLSWLPDGSAFGFVSEASGWAMLYLADVNGGVRQLTDGEWEVRRASLSPDGQTWYLTTSEAHPGEEHFYHLPARGGQLERITAGEGMHRAYASPDGRRLALTYETPRLMPDLYLTRNRLGSEARRVTKSGTDAFYRYDWTTSEIITFPDPAGKPTWAEVWAPPDHPNGAAVVYVHGCGECAQGVTKGWRRVRAKLYANHMRQRGYFVANLDYRGSWGYGHENRTYAYRQMGVSDVDSGMPFLDVLAERYGVDRERIGIYGGSYGGFFTLMSLFRHPGKYAAGVALFPVTDWAHYNQGYTSRILNGTPQGDEEAYRQSSPIYYAAGLQDALQIQHGLVDGNVQIQDSFRLAQVLIELGKDFDLVVYPVEDHGWDEVSTRLDSYKRMTRWFDRHLLGDGFATSSSSDGETR